MTRGTDMSTDTMPRTPRQAPARTVPPRRAEPRGAEPRYAEPSYARRPRPADAKAPSRAERRGTYPEAPGRPAPRSPGQWRRRFSAPRHTRPVAGSPPGPAVRPEPRPANRPAARPAGGPRPRLRRPRAPFILLLVGLLGGALISLLMISTTLAQGSFRITNLQQQNTDLARQEQLLTQEVAQAESPAQIAQEAEQFGMQQNPNLKFINLKTGKVVVGKVSQADSQINVPGFTP
jgi:hypothetical protein